MKLIAVLFSALLFAGLSVHNSAIAQPSGNLTSPNLVYMTTNPWQGPAGSNPGSWSNNFTTTTGSGGGLSGGNQPAYNATTGTFMFGYVQSTIAYTYAFSQALQTSGMTILGYNYSWDYINQDYTRGSLSANFTVNSTSNTSLYSKSWTLGTTTNGWTSFTGTETFTNPGLLASNIANFKLNFTGKDNRNWAGYYGPQFRNPSVTLNYTFDSCAADPLLSPTCPGYAAAYKTQQCGINPLYDSSCSGYAVAYKNQQCSLNALYSSDCPGYAAAYKTQQCSINPLYATDCPGYAVAYKNQQCSLNPLYATDCPGYAAAYHNQQCTLNPLYMTDCAGYQAAYFTQQCNLNGLYDQKCPNYAEAYAKNGTGVAAMKAVIEDGNPSKLYADVITPSSPAMGVSVANRARPVKSSGIETRGNGAATKGRIARGPLA